MSDVDFLLNKWREKFKRGFLRFIILRMFCEKDSENDFNVLNGMIIRDRIARSTNNNWVPSPGSIYPILAEMESDGLIEQVLREDAKKFKWYRITPLGLELVSLLRKDSLAFRPSDEVFTNPRLFEQFKKEFKSIHRDVSLEELERLYRRFTLMASITKELMDEKKRNSSQRS